MQNKLINQLEVAIYDLKTENNRLRQQLAELTHNEAFQRANADPTGQDLDDFLALHPIHLNSNDHIECPIQRAELNFGA